MTDSIIDQKTIPTIWLDITCFVQWVRPPIGIIRVEQELIKWSIANVMNISFFEYDSASRNFITIDKNLILSRFGSQKFLFSKFNTDLKHNIKKIIRDFYGIFQICAALLFRKRNYSRPKSALKKESGQIQQSELLHPFKSNDIILCVGMSWNHSYLNQDILSIRSSIKLIYYTLCHDLIPVKFPHLCTVNSEIFSRYLFELSQGDHVFCYSLSTEKDYKEFAREMKIPCPPTSVVMLGCEIYQTDKPSSKKIKLLNTPFILFVSTIERRKNHECIYKALLNLIESGRKNLPKLVFVGMKAWGVEDLLSDIDLDPRVQGSILILSEISDAELSGLYQNALFTVYSSCYEGWGLPIAESLNYGKMAIVSSTSSMPEVGRDLVDYVHPDDIIGWANQIAFYLDNPDELAKKEKKSRKHIKNIPGRIFVSRFLLKLPKIS